MDNKIRTVAPVIIAAVICIANSAAASLITETMPMANDRTSTVPDGLLAFSGLDELLVIKACDRDIEASGILRSVSTSMDLSAKEEQDKEKTESDWMTKLLAGRLPRPDCIFGFGAVYDKTIFAGAFI